MGSKDEAQAGQWELWASQKGIYSKIIRKGKVR
jgi:hypothetical protein